MRSAFEIVPIPSCVAGRNGNLNVDPRFTNAPAGDLTLAANSPVIDRADFNTAVAVGRDRVDASRVLDGSLTGAWAADMGAHERPAYRMTVGGRPKLGTSKGFTALGPAGAAVFALGLLNGQTLLAPFGVLTVGTPPFPLAVLPVGRPLVIGIPDGKVMVGLRFGMTAVGIPASPAGVGNLTEVYRGRVFR